MANSAERSLVGNPLFVYSQEMGKTVQFARDSTGVAAVTSIQNGEMQGAAKGTGATSLPQRDAAPETPAVSGYTEWAVPPALAPYLICAWRDWGDAPRSPVLPDACIDLLWDGEALHVAGPDTGPTPVGPQRDIFGLRFRPGVAPAFLGVAAHELRDRRVPLIDIWGGAARDLAEQAAASVDPTAPLAAALLTRLPSFDAPDPIITDLYLALRDTPTRIDRYAERLAVSERTLHRRALDALGYGPKTLARIVRFRRALALGRAGLSPARVAAAAGYADQAHLARECRRLAGTTPAALFADPALIVSADR